MATGSIHPQSYVVIAAATAAQPRQRDCGAGVLLPERPLPPTRARRGHGQPRATARPGPRSRASKTSRLGCCPPGSRPAGGPAPNQPRRSRSLRFGQSEPSDRRRTAVATRGWDPGIAGWRACGTSTSQASSVKNSSPQRGQMRLTSAWISIADRRREHLSRRCVRAFPEKRGRGRRDLGTNQSGIGNPTLGKVRSS